MSSWSSPIYGLRDHANPQGTATIICRTGSVGSLALVESSGNESADTGRTLTGMAAVFDMAGGPRPRGSLPGTDRANGFRQDAERERVAGFRCFSIMASTRNSAASFSVRSSL